MSRYSLAHLSDEALLHDLASMVAKDRSTTAELLAHIAEVDARKLYLPAGYPTMFAYCVGELHLSEDAASKRIHAARAASRFPAVFGAIARGRLHLSAVVLLAPHLTEDNAADLLAAAVHKSKADVERLLAARFPRPDVLAWVRPLPAPSACPTFPPAPWRVETPCPQPAETPVVPESVPDLHAPGHVDALDCPRNSEHPAPIMESHAPGHVDRSRVKPLSAQSYSVQFTLSQHGHDLLRYAQELLGHQVPAGEIGEVFERALGALVPQLEKARFAATDRPNLARRRETRSARHIPAEVKRAVWARDQGRCAFVSDTGRRCEARRGLQFDHVQEVARGGEATISGIRLLCRAHNQYAAECTFGAEFMRHKRLAAAEVRGTARAQSVSVPRASTAGHAAGGSTGSRAGDSA